MGFFRAVLLPAGLVTNVLSMSPLRIHRHGDVILINSRCVYTSSEMSDLPVYVDPAMIPKQPEKSPHRSPRSCENEAKATAWLANAWLVTDYF